MMSVVLTNSDGWVVCHHRFIRETYKGVLSLSNSQDMCYPEDLFKITTPFVRDNQAVKIYRKLISNSADISSGNFSQVKKRRTDNDKIKDLETEVLLVKSCMDSLVKGAAKVHHFQGRSTPEEVLLNNKTARDEAGKFYRSLCSNSHDWVGENTNNYPIEVKIQDALYVLPPKCTFFQNKIDVACNKLSEKKFDFILLDPPWKNKFVRRKKIKCSQLGYKMMEDEELEKLPISNLLGDSGLIAVWTTNAPSHIETLKEKIFPIWGVSYTATWFWLKVTQFGEEVTPFLSSNGKQPYERLIFGCKRNRPILNPEENKCIISVPSAIHSHKPPLIDVLKPYLPENPECLELFARYTLPKWTSCGDQVLSLQLSSLFEKIN